MSHYDKPDNSGKKPVGKKKFFKSPASRTTTSKPGSRPSSSSAPRRGSSQQGGSSSRRVIKKFNPSDFMRKVEEQVAAPMYDSKHQFSDFLIEEQLKKNIKVRGYVTPTPIQDQAIPLILEGKDVVGTANTGTGKTAAFLIPLVNRLLTGKTNRVLVITPTRELAAQIQDELAYFAKHTGFFSVLCIGGLNIRQQMSTLQQDPEFVIGTPGRLKDLEQNGHLRLNRYNSIVLDEVDTMLDMGFINDMKYIINKLPKDRHSVFFSATISKEIKDVIDKFLHNPVSISVKTRQSAENVNQEVITVDPRNKIEVLHDLLIKPDFTRVIIFVRTKRSTDKLAKSLRDRGFKIATIHGNKTQAQRKKALSDFKDGVVKILLATDVVARGIDIDDVSHVINFDLPQTHEDYIHRIGRTGRANKIGQAITFIEKEDDSMRRSGK
ncbi:DEAD/DEAH box helicase [Candidatus Babeliales bacterium]|nr:DEAD/DEAH box helicase [Candidatus Babeliales bacterium]